MKRDKPNYTRRSAIGLMCVGGGFFAAETLGFAHLSADRGVNINIADDEDAAFGIILGFSSITVINQTDSTLTVEITDTGDATLVTDDEIVLDPEDPDEANNDDKPGTAEFVFEPDNDAAKADITLQATRGGLTITAERTIDLVDNIEGDTQLLVDQSDDTRNKHTWDVANELPSNTSSIKVGELKFDYTDAEIINNGDFFADTRRPDVSLSVIDGDDEFREIRVNRASITDGPDNTLSFEIRDSFETGEIDRLNAGVAGVAAIEEDPAEGYDVTLALNPDDEEEEIDATVPDDAEFS